MASVLNLHLIYVIKFGSIVKFLEVFSSPIKSDSFKLSLIKLKNISDLAIFRSGNTEIKIWLSTSRFEHSFTKCSIILKPRIGVTNSCFATINGSTKLSFKIGIQKLNVTIFCTSNSVLSSALNFMTDVFVPQFFLMTLVSCYETAQEKF